MLARQTPSSEILWREAKSLARSAPKRRLHARPLPPLLFFTDPLRTPDPVSTAERLPAGSGIVYRHFGRDDAVSIGCALAAVARRRRLVLLVGADASLAEAVGAQGVHFPERSVRQATSLRSRRPLWIITAAAHDARAIARARLAGVDAAILSPVFPSRSGSAGFPLGALRSAVLIREAGLPVYALGGVNMRTVKSLRLTQAAGIAGVDGLIDDQN